MMLRKIKNFVKDFRNRIENISKQNDELIWANIFHDTIKGREWLRNLALSPGRWAADYAFLYVLVRVLSEYKPERIIEFGLGESTKVISSFLDNELIDSKHTVLEQDEKWMNVFQNKFKLSPKSELILLSLESRKVKGFSVNSYARIEDKINGIFDLYLIDGPFGSPHFSRYDIILLAERLKINDEFIIMIDDYNRVGEQETASDLIALLKGKGISVNKKVYSGLKSHLIIASDKYKFILSI